MRRLLFIVFVALLMVVYFGNSVRQQSNVPTLPTALPEVFRGVLPTQITRIEIENVTTGHKIILTKMPGDWQSVNEKNETLTVDYRQVTRMLDKLSNLRYSRVMQGTDMKEFGLASGGFFTVQFNAGVSHTLHIGDLSSDASFAYVQRENEPGILQVSSDQIYTLITLVSPQQ